MATRKHLDKEAQRNVHTTFLIVLIIATCMRILCGYAVGLVPDEAYYWDWTRYLSAGYFDHPPMIAWLGKLMTVLFSDTLVAVRSATVLGSLAVMAGLFLMARTLQLQVHGFFAAAAACISSTVLFGIGGFLFTPDIPLMVFWTFGMYFGYRSVFYREPVSWIALGICAGLGLLSKYTFVLFYGAFFIFCVSHKSTRRVLMSPWPYISAGISFLVFLPNIVWNGRHAWISYAFQLGHGLDTRSWPRFNIFGEYIGGQIGVVTPLLFILLCIGIYGWLRYYRRDTRLTYFGVFTLVPFLFFGWTSLGSRVEANWPAPAYIGGFMVTSYVWARFFRAGRKRLHTFGMISMLFALVVSCVVQVHAIRPVLPVPAKTDPTAQSRGWDVLGERVGTILRMHDPVVSLPITANRYQIAALMAFHIPWQPRTCALNIGSRQNHYSLLQRRILGNAKQTYFIFKMDDGEIPQRYKDCFPAMHLLGTATLPQGRKKEHEYGIARCTLPHTHAQ